MLDYHGQEQAWNGWTVTESAPHPDAPGKVETLFCQGNGYMGIRAATEEGSGAAVRGTYLSGIFNRFDDREVTELPNCPDVFGMEMRIDGIRFDPSRHPVEGYTRTLHLRDGELVRRLVWHTPESGRIRFEFRRFVSLERLHLAAQQVTITPLDKAVRLQFRAGIDGQVTNSGVQHFSEIGKRLWDGSVLQLAVQTTESRIGMVINAIQDFRLDGHPLAGGVLPVMDRRRMQQRGDVNVPAGAAFTMEKLATIHTTRDLPGGWCPEGGDPVAACAREDHSLECLVDVTWREMAALLRLGYQHLLSETARAWEQRIWAVCDIQVGCPDPGVQTKLRLARYHMTVMAPVHDARMSIAAKGLSGEGYKGHVFWDTEIFLLPAFLFAKPAWARSLLEYRHRTLEGARRKARENGCRGAMFPWESAWADDGEVTPVWGAADIVTGLPTKIWSGFIEQHITADVAHAVWQYWQATGDQDFMDRFGYEILLSTAEFWDSRAQWDPARGCRVIRDVVGPDEYKEHVDNDAFTNTMAWWNLVLAADLAERLNRDLPELARRMEQRCGFPEGLAHRVETWRKAADALYVPQPDETGLITQNDTYLSLPDIDLTPFRQAGRPGTIFDRYSLDQVNQLQVSKQADVVLLLLLLDGMHDTRIKARNYEYYQVRTLHDSSLSLSSHCALACDMGRWAEACDLFHQSLDIDFGEDPGSSDQGIHAAAIGGIWQCVVFGFGGLRIRNGQLRINPHLPEGWDSLRFPLAWQGERLVVQVWRNTLRILPQRPMRKELRIRIGDNLHTVGPEGLVLAWDRLVAKTD